MNTIGKLTLTVLAAGACLFGAVTAVAPSPTQQNSPSPRVSAALMSSQAKLEDRVARRETIAQKVSRDRQRAALAEWQRVERARKHRAAIAARKERLRQEKLRKQRVAAAAAKKRQQATRARSVSEPARGVWDRLAQCESGGNWSINTGNGFYGGLQFTVSSWRAVGGSGLPNHASRGEQIMRAEHLRAMQGWGAWPACSRKLGLR